MIRCDHCGEEFNYLFTCDKCGGSYCKDHKTPENHNCTSILNRKNNDIKFKNLKKEQIDNFSTQHTKDIAYDGQLILSKLLYSTEFEYTENKEKNIIFQSEKSEAVKDIKKEEKNKEKIIIGKVYNDIMEDLKKINIMKIMLSLFLILSLCLNGFLFIGYRDNKELYANYSYLYNGTIKLNSYYENLSDQHSELREEYEKLDQYYSDLLQTHGTLEAHYEDLINYQLNETLENRRTINIGPRDNYSIVYSIPFSGIVKIEYNASGDAYSWVGSTKTESYYSRNPQFPETASNLNFTIPVMPDVILYFANPSEFESIELTYKVDFTY